MKRRNLILLLGGASSGAMSVGTGAFSSMEAERGVSVNVSNDEDAFIRYDKPNDGVETEYGEEITLIRVRNQFGDNQELALVGVEYGYDDESTDDDVLRNVTVERYESPEDPDEELDDDDFTAVDEDGVAIKRGPVGGEYPAANEDDAFGPGEWVRIVADAYVPLGESVDVEVTITVTGVEESVSAQLFGDTRSFELHSAEDAPEDLVDRVKFPGNSGKVQIKTGSGGSGNQTANATVYYSTNENVKQTEEKTVELDTQLTLGGEFGISQFDSIVGIDIAGISGVFVYPNFDKSACKVLNGGGSGNSGGEVDVSTDLPTEDDAFGDCL